MDKEPTGRQAAEGDKTTGYRTMQQAGGKWGWGSGRQQEATGSNATALASAKPEDDATWSCYSYCPVYLVLFL